MPEYKNISLKKEFAEEIEKIIKANPHLGFRSLTQFVEHSMRWRMEQLRATQTPRFELINCDEHGIKVLDRQIHRVAQVHIKPQGIRCEVCRKNDCSHIAFGLSQPKVQTIIRKHRKEGWNLPEV